MEVITWQLVIIGSIVACRFGYPKAVVWLCAGWTVFTLSMLFYAPLIVIQLISIWGSWFVIRHIDNQSRSISKRDEIIRNLPAEMRSAVKNTPPARERVIEGREHLDFMNDEIGKAAGVIVILSGWISDRVVNDKFAGLLDRKLRDGCQIYIGYGWEDSEGRHTESAPAKRALQKLGRLKKSHRENLHVAKYATHEKTLIIDDTVVLGSNNWLSNSAFKNSERSLAVTKGELALQEQERLRPLILQHARHFRSPP